MQRRRSPLPQPRRHTQALPSNLLTPAPALLSHPQGCYLLVFTSALDAVRFCHAGQALLMYSHWPDECKDYMCATDVTADNRSALACRLPGGLPTLLPGAGRCSPFDSRGITCIAFC